MSNNTNNNNFSKYKINKRNQNVNNSQIVSCLACNPKGEKPNIIVGFDNGMIKLFNFDVKGNFTCIDILYEHDNWISYILFNPINPLVFLSYSKYEKVILWNLMNEELDWIEYTLGSVFPNTLIFNYDGSILFYTFKNHYVFHKIIYSKRINSGEEIKECILSSAYQSVLQMNQYILNSYFHPNNNLIYMDIDYKFIEYAIFIFSINYSRNEIIKLKHINLSSICKYNHGHLISSLNMTGNILFLVVQSIKVLYILNEIGEYIKEYDLNEYFKEYEIPNIIPLFHPKNPELLVLYNYKNIIILQITSSRIKCLYRYRIKGLVNC